MSRLLSVLPAALVALSAGAAHADTSATANYVINLGGNILASATFKFNENGTNYTLDLDANVSGIAQLVAAGTAKADSSGAVTENGLRSNAFNLITHSGGEAFKVQVAYAGGDVSAFVIDPPIVNNINRIPIERKQLTGVNDMLATFIKKGPLDKSVCDDHAPVFTGIERFDLDFRYAKDDTATSPRTGYQGPVILCHIAYKPISGHYTTSEITNSLAQDDRILIWYAPLHDTGWLIPYRVLLTTSMGDLSMVLTSLN